MPVLDRRSRWQWIWPPTHDIASARLAADHGFYAAAFCAVATALGVLLTRFGIELIRPGFLDLTSLLGAAVFVTIAWGIRRQFRIAAVLGLLLYLARWLYVWITVGPGNPVIALLLILAFVSGVRGTFAYQKHQRSKFART